ncbi:MAG: MBL fold metallo-hydrolase [Aeromonas hydrophila]
MNSFCRTFHSVGQGAFYSEKHNGFNVVYDCGNWKDSKKATSVVKSSFKFNDVIDILFISHFDYDHVSKINVLANNFKIKNVVMPLLHDEEVNVLVNIYRTLGKNILNLLRAPERYFGENTKVIRVAASNLNGEESLEARPVILVDDLINGSTIESGSILKASFKFQEWCFIPYNHENTSRRIELETALLSSGLTGFDLMGIKGDPNYTIKRIVDDVGLAKSKGGRKFRDAYEKITGGININSMLVFSGLLCGPNAGRCNDYTAMGMCKCFFDKYTASGLRRFEFCVSPRIACVYTGDCDLNLVKPKQIYRDFWEWVGTIQVPHHGANSNFCLDILDSSHYFFPISVGLKNTYSHPCKNVIDDILRNGSTPVCVTEDPSSEFKQYFKYWC